LCPRREIASALPFENIAFIEALCRQRLAMTRSDWHLRFGIVAFEELLWLGCVASEES